KVRDATRHRGALESVAEFSTYLPMAVIAEMLGLPVELRAQLRNCSDRILARPDADGEAVAPEDALDPMTEMMELLAGVVADHAVHPGDDIATMLPEARVTDD